MSWPWGCCEYCRNRASLVGRHGGPTSFSALLSVQHQTPWHQRLETDPRSRINHLGGVPAGTNGGMSLLERWRLSMRPF